MAKKTTKSVSRFPQRGMRGLRERFPLAERLVQMRVFTESSVFMFEGDASSVLVRHGLRLESCEKVDRMHDLLVEIDQRLERCPICQQGERLISTGRIMHGASCDLGRAVDQR